MDRSDKPFPETLVALLVERDLSMRELSRITRKRGDGLGHASISLLARGDMPPTRSAMEQIAAALEVPADHFAEHRLEVVRDDLNWRVLGTKRALANLADLRSGAR